MSELLERINNAVKDAMRNQDKRRLVTLRLITSSIKQQEIDNRTETTRNALTDEGIITVIERMIKQRLDAKEQFEKANRTDLADQEAFEINLLREYMPTPLSDEELNTLILSAIDVIHPNGLADMGKVMTYLKTQIKGRADMKIVSEKIKEKLS